MIIGFAVETYKADWENGKGGSGEGGRGMARFTLFTHSRKGEGSVQLALDDHGDDDVNYGVHCVVNMSHPSQYPAVFTPNFAIFHFPLFYCYPS